MEPTASRPSAATDSMSDFLRDIEPLFLRRQVMYADVGANRGDTFATIYQSPLKINRACLIEANPRIFTTLQQRVSDLGAEERATCLNMAMSDSPGSVTLSDMNDMSSVVQDGDVADGQVTFSVEACKLDSLANLFPDGHISILKIDVEGHEAEVLRGAEALLSSHAIEVIYIEAGLNPDNHQQTYYRTIEDILMSHGYRLFRIYEQTPEWIDDRPLLRRMNMAFVSPVVVAKYPWSLLQEMQRRETLLRDAKANSADLSVKVKALTDELSGREQEILANKEVISEKTAEISAKTKEHAVLMRRIVDLEDGKKALEVELEETKQAMKAELASAKVTLVGVKRTLEDTRKTSKMDMAEAAQRRQKLLDERKVLAARVRALESSASWRITAPLRGIKRVLRGK